MGDELWRHVTQLTQSLIRRRRSGRTESRAEQRVEQLRMNARQMIIIALLQLDSLSD